MEQNPVCRRAVTVNLESGLHIRPMSQIAKIANCFACELYIISGGVSVDAKSVLELMTLNAPRGTVLIIEGNGEHAPEAVDRVAHLFEIDFESENDETSDD